MKNCFKVKSTQNELIVKSFLKILYKSNCILFISKSMLFNRIELKGEIKWQLKVA